MAHTRRSVTLLFAALLLLAAFPARARADVVFPGAYGRPGLGWTQVNPRPVNETLWAVAYGNGTWVAASDHAIYSSPDGERWSQTAPFSTEYSHLIRVRFAGGRFLVTNGEDGLVSADGVRWEAAPGLTDHAFGQGRCAAIVKGRLAVAEDCLTYKEVALGPDVPLDRVLYAGGQFMATNGYHTYLSKDGLAWEMITSRIHSEARIYSVGGRYLYFYNNTGIEVSDDGRTWNRILQTGITDWGGVTGASDQAVLMIATNGAIWTTSDGLAWERTGRITLSGTSDREPWRAVAAGDGGWVAVGEGGAIARSTDGRTWQIVTVGMLHPWTSVASLNGRFAAIASAGSSGGLLYTSANGLDWRFEQMIPSLQWLPRVFSSGGRLWAIDGEGVVQLSSADGVTWSPPDQKVRLLSRQGPALLLGYSGLTLSAEGAAPVSLTLPENFSPVGGVVEGGRTVLVARDALAVSTDGRTWQVTRPAKRACELGSVVAGKGNLFAMCWLGASEMLHSEDGVNWQSLPDFWAYNLMFEGDRFFAVGHDTLLTSGDGKTWETRHQTPQIASVAYGNGRYVAVGAAGLILVSDPVTPSATGPSVAAPDLVGSSLQIDATESVGQPYKVTITLRDAEGRPMAGRPVRLGEAERYSTNQVQVTNANGQARFQFLGFYGDMKTATYLAQDILTGRWLQSRVSLRHTTCGQRFADVSDRHESCREIETAAVRGLMGGYPDGSFRGNQQLTRAELAKVAVLAAGRKPEPGQTLPFHDTTGHWAARDGYLQAAVALGAIQGDPGGRFRPDAPVTRADLVKVMAVIAGLKPAAVKAEDWYVPWVVSAYAMRLIGALVPAPLFPAAESLAAEQPATREETARILTNLYYLQMRQPTQ